MVPLAVPSTGRRSEEQEIPKMGEENEDEQ